MANKELKVAPKTYRVSPGSNVLLTVTIGQAQLGASLALLDQEELEGRAFNRKFLGTGDSLTGRTLQIITMVSDVRKQTNRTSVKYELTGGMTPLHFEAADNVDEEGDMVLYLATISFEAQ